MRGAAIELECWLLSARWSWSSPSWLPPLTPWSKVGSQMSEARAVLLLTKCCGEQSVTDTANSC